MLISILLFTIAFAVVQAFAPLFQWLAGRDGRMRLICAAVSTGYFCGAAGAWCFVPREWKLSFPETLAATVDSARYGHPVEHYAEGVVIMMITAAAFCAVMSGVAVGLSLRLLKRSA